MKLADLSPAQRRNLLSKHLTGDYGATAWRTLQVLLAKGYVAVNGKNTIVTDKGKAYCDTYHMQIR